MPLFAEKGDHNDFQDVQALRTSYEAKYNWEEQCGALVEKMWSMVQGNIFASFVPTVSKEWIFNFVWYAHWNKILNANV